MLIRQQNKKLDSKSKTVALNKKPHSSHCGVFSLVALTQRFGLLHVLRDTEKLRKQGYRFPRRGSTC